MSDKIGYNSWVPSLSDAASLTGAELLALVQSSATMKVSLSTLATYFGGGGSVGLPAVLGNDPSTNNIAIVSPDLSSSVAVYDAANGGLVLTGGTATLGLNTISNDITGNATSITFNSGTGNQIYLSSTATSLANLTKIVLNSPIVNFGNAAFTSSTLGYFDASKNLISLGIGSGLSIVGGNLVASGSGGTVTAVSIATANGFSGSSSGGTTPALTISLQNATTSQSGQITSTDWNTFNNKLSTATAASTYAPINNPTFTGTVTLAQDAASNLQAVTLQQLNNAILGQDYKVACKYVTVATLPTYIYNNGSSGVGATITGVSFGAITFDGVTPSVGDRVLVVDEVGGNAPYNGAYTVTVVGTGASLFLLTRATDFNTPSEINGGNAFFISLGNTKAASTYVYNGVSAPTIGTSNIIFTQTQGQGVYSAGTGLTLSLNTFAIDTSVVATLTGSQALTNKTYNGMTITSNSGTFAVGNAKSAIISNTLTFTGTDGSSVAFGTGGTVAYTNVATLSSLTSIGTLTNLTVTNAPTFSFATAGSILFADTAGLQAQDNNNLYWNKGSHILSVNCNGDTTGTDSINIYKQLDSFCINTSDNGFSISNARGSVGSFTENTANDYIGLVGFYPYNGSAWTEYASMRSYVKGATSTNRGADLEFWTKQNGGSLTLALTLDNTQNATFGGGIIAVAGTTSLAPLNFPSGTLKTSVAAGDMEYDGKAHYLTHATSERGAVPSTQFITLTTAYTTSSGSISLQAMFNSPANGQVTVAANTTYFFECVFSLSSMSGSSGNFSFGIGGTASLTRVNWIGLATKAASTQSTPSLTRGTSGAAVILTTSNTNTTGQAFISGKIVVGTGGTIIPQFIINIAAAAVVGVDSYFKIWAAGADTVQSVGNWS